MGGSAPEETGELPPELAGSAPPHLHAAVCIDLNQEYELHKNNDMEQREIHHAENKKNVDANMHQI